jgi:hypothetical protein
MDAETLLPLVTFILGLAGALATEAFRDRRASSRERQARQAELQRTTLLELQDALLELFNLASEADLAAFMVTLEDAREQTKNPAAKREAEEDARRATKRLHDADAKARLLISRVQDEQARRAATLFRHAADMVVVVDPKAEELDLTRISRATETYGKAVDLLGKLLRERY